MRNKRVPEEKCCSGTHLLNKWQILEACGYDENQQMETDDATGLNSFMGTTTITFAWRILFAKNNQTLFSFVKGKKADMLY